MAKLRGFRLFAICFASAVVAYYLIEVLFAFTVGGTGQLSDFKYMFVVSTIFAVFAWLGRLTKHPYLFGGILATILFVTMQIIRHRTLPWEFIIVFSDLLFDYGFFLLPAALADGYIRREARQSEATG